MSLKSLPIAPIPEEVVRIALAVFPRETSSLDELLTSPPGSEVGMSLIKFVFTAGH